MSDPAQADRLVLSYLSEAHYHRGHPDDEDRPLCRPKRARGVLSHRMKVEREGQRRCPDCWPETCH
jgi:hypothetical protein